MPSFTPPASRLRAALGSLLFLLVAPGVVVGLIPWWLTAGWTPGSTVVILQVLGWILIALGVGAVLWAFGQFVVEGVGTPAPVAPTQTLVVGGLYRYVRNPMYVSLLCAIVGQALVLGRWVLLLYALCVWALPALFVRFYEEPTLLETYGDSYREYRAHVRGWIPRLRPWSPPIRNHTGGD
jgi:protein-S-isoprenylcysteine O-methyltransferase Ste14